MQDGRSITGFPAFSRNDVRIEFVTDCDDSVFQRQLALLEPAKLKLIAVRGGLQRQNGFVQVAMFLAKDFQSGENCILVVHSR